MLRPYWRHDKTCHEESQLIVAFGVLKSYSPQKIRAPHVRPYHEKRIETINV